MESLKIDLSLGVLGGICWSSTLIFYMLTALVRLVVTGTVY
jgi:aspartate/glutamate racemase